MCNTNVKEDLLRWYEGYVELAAKYAMRGDLSEAMRYANLALEAWRKADTIETDPWTDYLNGHNPGIAGNCKVGEP